MALFLVDPGQDLSLELFVSGQTEEALALQWERLKDSATREAFCRRLETRLSEVLPELLDWDIKAPTKAQVAFATAISSKLGVPLSVEALRYRGRMTAFLEEYAPLMKSKRPSKARPDPPPDPDIPF